MGHKHVPEFGTQETGVCHVLNGKCHLAKKSAFLSSAMQHLSLLLRQGIFQLSNRHLPKCQTKSETS